MGRGRRGVEDTAASSGLQSLTGHVLLRIFHQEAKPTGQAQ